MILNETDIERLMALAKYDRPEPEKQLLAFNLNKVLGEMEIIDKPDGIVVGKLTRSQKPANRIKNR